MIESLPRGRVVLEHFEDAVAAREEAIAGQAEEGAGEDEGALRGVIGAFRSAMGASLEFGELLVSPRLAGWWLVASVDAGVVGAMEIDGLVAGTECRVAGQTGFFDLTSELGEFLV